jgi:hypothetical protein
MNIKMILKSSKNAQIFLFEIFIIILIIIIIIFINIRFFSKYNLIYEIKENNLNTLEQILILDNIIKDCNYLANYTNRCYDNEIVLNNINNIKKYKNINKIKLDNIIIYKDQNTHFINCYNRGVVEEDKFKVIEVCFNE